jgi:hypothetical protein
VAEIEKAEEIDATCNRLFAIFSSFYPELSNEEILEMMTQVELWQNGSEILITRGRDALFTFPEAWLKDLHMWQTAILRIESPDQC